MTTLSDRQRDHTALSHTDAQALPEARFVMSVAELNQLPSATTPEIAFVGRSNAGKSSAINALTNRRRLAFASKAPGRTQTLNLFQLGDAGFLADLPGYGYASAGGDIRRQWDRLLSTYLLNRASLVGVVLLMDIRHPLKSSDIEFLRWISEAGREICILLTKADKLPRSERLGVLREVRAELRRLGIAAQVETFSSTSGEGVEAARGLIRRWLKTKTEAPYLRE